MVNSSLTNRRKGNTRHHVGYSPGFRTLWKAEWARHAPTNSGTGDYKPIKRLEIRSLHSTALQLMQGCTPPFARPNGSYHHPSSFHIMGSNGRHFSIVSSAPVPPVSRSSFTFHISCQSSSYSHSLDTNGASDASLTENKEGSLQMQQAGVVEQGGQSLSEGSKDVLVLPYS